MTAIIIWATRLLVLYLIVRIVFSLFMKKRPSSGPNRETAQRFDAKGKKVVDADFEEL